MGSDGMLMRDVLIHRIHKGMREDEKIFLLTADMGAPALDRLLVEFPDRCINVGIAEQNLVSVATGLSLEGFTVFAYGIAPFITMRAYDQTRVGLSLLSHLRALNVILLGVGVGFSYEVSGPTHHCVEDLTIMRLLPNMAVCSPGDGATVEAFYEFALTEPGPKYLRLDAKPAPAIYESISEVDFRRGFHEFPGSGDACIVSTGYPTQRALRLREEMEREGVRIGVVDMFLLQPMDDAALAKVLYKYRRIFSFEESFIGKGGLDALVSNVLRRFGVPATLESFGLSGGYVFENGGREHLYRVYGMDDESILGRLRSVPSPPFRIPA